jgi:glycosyltransferase involved in cell wall biosynthesis
MKINKDISVIITVSKKQLRHNVEQLYYTYKRSIETVARSFEFIYVTDDDSNEMLGALQNLQELGEDIKIIKLAKWFGDASALHIGFEEAAGKNILTLPAFQQVDVEVIPDLTNSFIDCDMLIARRHSIRVQAKIFHFLVKVFLGMHYRDLGCRVRLFKREVLENIRLYGDQIRFLPLLANRYGFKVREKEVKQFQSGVSQRVYSLGHYTERLVDLISIFFLIKFTKKPLRFFGVPGFIIFSLGFMLALYLLYQRLFLNESLADKPIVLVSILLIVFGIQLFAIGLVAEIIIFTHSKDSKEYIIEKVIGGEEFQFEKEHTIKPEIEEKV